MMASIYSNGFTATMPWRSSLCVAASLLVMAASCADTAAPGQVDASTPGQPDASTPQQPDASTPQQPDASTPQQPDASTPQQPDASTPQQPDASTPADAASVSGPITITQIQVLNETDGFGVLEVEVHMVDASNGLLIGCSGDYNGLATVNDQGVLYSSLSAHFVPPDTPPHGDAPPEEWITLADIQNKNVRLLVIEDDSGPCPEPIGSFDDPIATSNVFSGATLATLPTMSFGDVSVLTLGVLP